MLKEITPPQMPMLIEDLGMLYPNNTSKQKKHYGIFECSCGKKFKTQTQQVKTGHTKSCGCYHIQRAKESKISHGLSKHKIASVWYSMARRCTSTKNKRFKDYGGRGITICDRWINMENFIADMGDTYIEGLTIDRIDNDKGYSPDNCRWTTKEVQNRNTRILKSTNTSGYRGVYFAKRSKKWVSRIRVNYDRKILGSFLTAFEAAKAYDQYVIENNLEHTKNFKDVP